MVEKIVTKYILALIKAQVITEKEKETYQYHIICAVESILVMLTMTGVGFYFHEVIHVWAFIACFFMIRNRTGGFHFDSFWKCYLGTVGLEIFVIYLVDFTSNNVIVIDLFCLCVFGVILRIGAMNHKNMNYDVQEYQAIKKKARLASTGVIAVIIILKILQIIGKTVLYMEYAVIFSGIMLVLGIIVGQETDERRKFFGNNN